MEKVLLTILLERHLTEFNQALELARSKLAEITPVTTTKEHLAVAEAMATGVRCRYFVDQTCDVPSHWHDVEHSDTTALDPLTQAVAAFDQLIQRLKIAS